MSRMTFLFLGIASRFFLKNVRDVMSGKTLASASDVHAKSAVRIPSIVCAYRAHGILDFAVTQHHFVGLD